MNRGRLAPAVELAMVLAFLLVVVFLSTEFLARPWVVYGRSMEPTLGAGDRVIVDLWTYRHRAPRAGEIVVIRGEAPDSSPIVKRVALAPLGTPSSQGTLWVLGDNPPASTDSRQLGGIPSERVLGRVALVYWPPGRAGSPRPLPRTFELPVR